MSHAPECIFKTQGPSVSLRVMSQSVSLESLISVYL